MYSMAERSPFKSIGIRVLGLLSILSPIGISFRGYLRQGFVAKYYLSEVGSLIWILIGFLLGFGSFFTVYILTKSHSSSDSPKKHEKLKIWSYSLFFISFIISAFSMGSQPVSFFSYSTGQTCLGVALNFALFLIILENPFTLKKLTLHHWLQKGISLILQIFLCGILILPSILAGEYIQSQYFSWLFVLMGLPLVWNFLTLTLLGLFGIFILSLIIIRIQENKSIFWHQIPQKHQKYLQFVSVSLIALLVGSIYFFNLSQIRLFQNPTEPAIPHYAASQVSNFNVQLPSEAQDWEALFTHVNEILESNLFMDRATQTQLFAHPSEHFQKGWYWDTAFIVLIWKYYNPSIAEQLLIDYLKGALNPNGLVSHMYYPNCKSGISQPPLFAWASMELYNQTQNFEFLQKIFTLLEKAFPYWEQFRDPEANHLYSWQTLDETGQDNTLALGPNPQQTEALDLSVYVAFEAEKMATMAHILGFQDKSNMYNFKSDQIKNAVRTLCWDNETQFFYSLSKESHTPIYVKAASAFLTLISGIASDYQADAIINRYLLNSSEFGTNYPIPTTSLADPTYEPYYWRGPVWVCMNYLIAKGLERYNRADIAHNIYLKTIEMVSQVFQERGKVYELYHPITGNVTDVFNPSGGLPSSNMVGWTGLVNTILIEEILGIHMEGNHLKITPEIPSHWQNTTIIYDSPRFRVEFQQNLELIWQYELDLKEPSKVF